MTLKGAIMELVMLSEHPIMPVIFKPSIQKIIETVSECEEPSMIPERKKGKWTHERLASTTGGSYPITRCSRCQGAMPFEWEVQFCPFCGADMRGEQDV